MKILCPLCDKILPRFESVLIHIKRVHPNINPEKALKLAYNAKIIGKKHRKNPSSYLKRERNILLGISPGYKKEKAHSIHWKSVIKTPCK